jgi:hypothetical protein
MKKVKYFEKKFKKFSKNEGSPIKALPLARELPAGPPRFTRKTYKYSKKMNIYTS